MKTHKTAVARAAATAWLGLAAASAAHAGPVVTTASVAFDYAASVTDSEGGGATSQSNVALGSSQLSQFDPTLGVLTGATLVLNSTRTQTTSVTSTAGSATMGPNGLVTSSGNGGSAAALTIGGVSTSLGTIGQADSCSDHQRGACNDGANSSNTATNASLAISASNGLVGNGSVGVQASLPQLSANQGPGQFNGAESTAYQLQWSGTLGLSYEYLLHAAASFGANGMQPVLSLNFGDVALGSNAVLGFDLFNLAGTDRVGLDLDSIIGNGDTGKLSTDLAAFVALGAGGASGFQAMLDTGSAGEFFASYVLNLSDADVGAEASRIAHSLTLNLSGRVLDRNASGDAIARNDVPEPASLALVAAGLAWIGLAGQRRRRT